MTVCSDDAVDLAVDVVAAGHGRTSILSAVSIVCARTDVNSENAENGFPPNIGTKPKYPFSLLTLGAGYGKIGTSPYWIGPESEDGSRLFFRSSTQP